MGLQEGKEYDCTLVASDRDGILWESKESINEYDLLIESEYEERILSSEFGGAVEVVAVQEKNEIAFCEITFVPDIHTSDVDVRKLDPSDFDRIVECKIEYIDKNTEKGVPIEYRLKRCLATMRKECPREEFNFYESE